MNRRTGTQRTDSVTCWLCAPCCFATTTRRFDILTRHASNHLHDDPSLEVREKSERAHVSDVKIKHDSWKERVKALFKKRTKTLQSNLADVPEDTRMRSPRSPRDGNRPMATPRGQPNSDKSSIMSKLKEEYRDKADRSRRVEAILVRSDVRAGYSLEDHYEFVQELGSGKYGTVERWRTRDGIKGQGSDVAVKKISWKNVSSSKFLRTRCLIKTFDKDAIRNVENELRMFLELDNPFIVKGREWFEHSWKGIYFVMEYLTGETMQDLLDGWVEQSGVKSPYSPENLHNSMKNFRTDEHEAPWTKCRRLFNHICYAISYMHSKKILHRDLKPDNIMLVKEKDYTCCKLIDFGLSEVSTEDAMGISKKSKEKVIVGTLTFMSPEMLLEASQHSQASDIWAMGVILIWMLSAVTKGQLIHPYSQDEVILEGFISPGGQDFFFFISAFDEEPHWNRNLFADVGLDHAFFEVADGLLEKAPERRMSANVLLNSEFVSAPLERHQFGKSQLVGEQNNDQNNGILGSIRSYANLSKFDQAILSVMAEHITPSQVRGIQRTFRRLDKDQNGKLSQDELLGAFEQAGVKLSQEDMDDVNKLFCGGTKELDYSDWVATEIANTVVQDEVIAQNAFWSLDTSGTGNIIMDDLELVVGWKEATVLFKQLGKQEDEGISFEEFKNIIAEIAMKRASIITGGVNQTIEEGPGTPVCRS